MSTGGFHVNGDQKSEADKIIEEMEKIYLKMCQDPQVSRQDLIDYEKHMLSVKQKAKEIDEIVESIASMREIEQRNAPFHVRHLTTIIFGTVIILLLLTVIFSSEITELLLK